MDRISSLPDEVLCHVLSFLPTKYAVATSILSSRWVNLWTLLSIIDLDDSLYLNPTRNDSSSLAFLDFVDRVLSLNQSQTIDMFRLHIDSRDTCMSKINGFISKVMLKNVVEIDLGIFLHYPEDGECLKIPDSQSLKVLKIQSQSGLEMPVFPGCFPSLVVFDSNVQLYLTSDEVIDNMFSSLSVLEKLSIGEDLSDCSGRACVYIGGIALKSLELDLLVDNCYYYTGCDVMFVICAPHLEYLRIHDRFLASYLIISKPAISEVSLDLGDSNEEFYEFLDEMDPRRQRRFSELLQGLVNAKFVSVSATTSKLIFLQKWNINIPILPSLTKLELDVHTSSWIVVLYWLESCPHLKVLSLIIKEKPADELDRLEELELTQPDHVPSCLLLHLKEIEIKRLGKVEEEDMLNYLLDNAKLLDKFTVNSRVHIKDGILQQMF